MRQLFGIVFIVSLLFSFLGSVMGFLITYEEYAHHYTDKKRPFRHAMQTAIFTFIVFFILTVLAVLFLMRTK